MKQSIFLILFLCISSNSCAMQREPFDPQALLPTLVALQMASGQPVLWQPSNPEAKIQQEALKQQHEQELHRQSRHQNNLRNRKNSSKQVKQPKRGPF